MDIVKRHTPVMNEKVVRGYTTYKIKEAPAYLDHIFRWAFENMNSVCQLTYDGFEIATPKEEFEEASKPRATKRSVNVGKSTIYMVKFYFTYKGEPLPPRFVYLPYCEEGNIFYLSGTRYFLFPVLANKIISATSDGLFVKMLKDKKIFVREYINVYVNSQVKHTYYVKSVLFDATQRRKKMPDTTNCSPTNMHYILAKYGLNNFFMKFHGFIPEIHTYTEFGINPDNKYDLNDYFDLSKVDIIESLRIKPRNYKDQYYYPTDIFFVVPKEHMDENVLTSLGTIIYILDNFPDKIRKEDMGKAFPWLRTLGYINFTSAYDNAQLVEKMNEHFDSLEETMNEFIVNKLAQIGYDCHDIYDLLYYLKRDFAQWYSCSDVISSMYGKELDVLYSTLSHMVHAIFKAVYDIKKKVNNQKELSKSEINEILVKRVRTGMIFDLSKNTAGTRSNMSTLSYSGDNMFFKITSTIIPQEGNHGGKGKGKVKLDDPNNKLHASYAEAGGYLAITKPAPIGNGKINPFVTLDDEGTIIPSDDLKDVVINTQDKLT